MAHVGLVPAGHLRAAVLSSRQQKVEMNGTVGMGNYGLNTYYGIAEVCYACESVLCTSEFSGGGTERSPIC